QLKTTRKLLRAQEGLLAAQQALRASTASAGSPERAQLEHELAQAWQQLRWAENPPKAPNMRIGLAQPLAGSALTSTATASATTQTIPGGVMAQLPTTPLAGGALRHHTTIGLNLPPQYAAYAESPVVFDRKQRQVDLAFFAEGTSGLVGGAVGLSDKGGYSEALAPVIGLVSGGASALVTSKTTPNQ